jgi:hypothetical protein
MFTPLPGRTTLGVSPDRIIAIIESINAPNIAIPDVGTEPTRAWLIGCLTPAGGACIFCCLLPTESGHPAFYISNPPETTLDRYSALEHESIQFVESMGFLLDNLNFRARPAHEVAMLIETLPFFREPQARVVVGAVLERGPEPVPRAAHGSTTTTPERTALLRLLVSY